MKLTKRIKLTRGRAHPGARWVPLGYYRNRKHIPHYAAGLGVIYNLTLCCAPLLKL
jgi:hypothetical protein